MAIIIIMQAVAVVVFSSTASDIGGIYYLMQESIPSNVDVTSAAITTATTTNIFNFATAARVS